MNTILFSFAFFAFIMLIMAVGYLVAGKSIKGSCGGLNAIDGLEGACDICEGRKQCRRKRRAQMMASSDQNKDKQEQTIRFIK